MDSSLHLCAHFLDAPDFRFDAPDCYLEFYDGPVDAVAECNRCGSLALLALLDWSDRLGHRVFAVAAAEPAPWQLLRRNLSRGSCDLARRGSEIAAFVASAGPVEALIGYDVRAERVLSGARAPAGTYLPRDELSARVPDPAELRWFALLGLDKRAA